MSSPYPIMLLLACCSFWLCACSEAPAANKPSADLTYAAIARGKIDVEGGVITLNTPGEGAFSEVRVGPGAQVKQGELLASLDAKPQQLALELLTAETQRAKAELAGLEAQRQAAEQLLQRWRKAVKAGAAEQQQLVDAQQALATINVQIQSAQAGLAIERVKQKQADYELNLRQLRAPQDGQIIKVFAQAGSHLATNNSTAFVLLPNKPLQVRAEINESFLSRVQVGNKASVLLEANSQAAPMEAQVVRLGAMLEPGHNGDEQQPTRVVEAILEFEQPQNVLVGQNVMVKFHEQH